MGSSELIHLSEVRLARARPEQVETGMVGHISLVVGDLLKLDGIALRRTRRGHHALSFPCRRDRRGHEHALIRPLTDDARRRIERQVFEALGVGGGS